MEKEPHNARRNLVIQLALDVLFVAETCWIWNWGPSAHPPVRPMAVRNFDALVLWRYTAACAALPGTDRALAGTAKAGSGRK